MARQDLYKLLQECTVRLSSSSGIGTGFFIAPGGWILTCYHVVEGSDNVGVLWLSREGKQELTATVRLRVPIPVDIALLQIEGKTPVHKCVYLDNSFPQIGDSLYTFGYPQGYGTEIYSGGDSATTKYEGKSFQDDVIVLKLKEGHIQEGYSGSPLLNVRTGKVCGIVSVSRDTSSDLGGRATPIPLLFQPKELTASPHEQQLILSKLKENKKFHQKIYRKWTQIVSPPFWTRKPVILFSLSIIFLLTISLYIWRRHNPPVMTGTYNVAVTDFATINRNGKLQISNDGKMFSEWLIKSLEAQKKQQTIIDTSSWEISKPNKYINADSIEGFEKKLKSLMKKINAKLLLYGYITETDNQNNKIFTLSFYFFPNNESSSTASSGFIDVFDLKGDPIGKPTLIDVRNNLKIGNVLLSKVKPLFWLITYLSYIDTDQNKIKIQALFQQVANTLEKEWREGEEGQEVFYYCLGQVALFAANSPKTSNISLNVAKEYAKQAEESFNNATQLNNEYIKPHIGLGSVYLTRAEWYYDEIDKIDKDFKSVAPNRRSELQKKRDAESNRDAELNKAIASYEKALKQLPQSQHDDWSKYAASLGLGYAWYLKGDTELNFYQYEKAEEWQKKAFEITQEIIEPLKIAKKYRLLAQAYSNLGLVYWLDAKLHLGREDTEKFLNMSQKASEAFLSCKNQGEKAPNDYILNQNIVKYCEDNIKLIKRG
ncbi:MAG: trypsin-like peptidase domain-containing protein [Desmonostoc geniculatum HA4340-LM1]|jgi:tetratricopeptide (TPR) repeat protein|nr:trypsin-like peptidase domain-containing protein [Desmonostoc geniculatum HA4340-LM1]